MFRRARDWTIDFVVSAASVLGLIGLVAFGGVLFWRSLFVVLRYFECVK